MIEEYLATGSIREVRGGVWHCVVGVSPSSKRKKLNYKMIEKLIKKLVKLNKGLQCSYLQIEEQKMASLQ